MILYINSIKLGIPTFSILYVNDIKKINATSMDSVILAFFFFNVEYGIKKYKPLIILNKFFSY